MTKDRPVLTSTDGVDPHGRSLIARAFRTIEFLADEPRSAADVARYFGTDRSTALRLLRELEATGYVSRDQATKLYVTSGAHFYRLLSSTKDHAELSELVDPILRSVRDDFGETTVLAVLAGDSMVYAAIFTSTHVIRVREQLGTLRPVYCSAVGKAFLSGLDEAALDGELGRLAFEGGTRNAAQDIPSLLGRVATARQLGYAVDRDETSLGVSCVAAPLWVGDALIGAIGATGPTTRFTDELVAIIGRRLRAAVEEIRSISSGRGP